MSFADPLNDPFDINSVGNPRANGYRPQLDSKDDQLSITQGYYHALFNNYLLK